MSSEGEKSFGLGAISGLIAFLRWPLIHVRDLSGSETRLGGKVCFVVQRRLWWMVKLIQFWHPRNSTIVECQWKILDDPRQTESRTYLDVRYRRTFLTFSRIQPYPLNHFSFREQTWNGNLLDWLHWCRMTRESVWQNNIWWNPSRKNVTKEGWYPRIIFIPL